MQKRKKRKKVKKFKTRFIITYSEDIEWTASTLKAARECAEDMKQDYGYTPTIYAARRVQKEDKY